MCHSGPNGFQVGNQQRTVNAVKRQIGGCVWRGNFKRLATAIRYSFSLAFEHRPAKRLPSLDVMAALVAQFMKNSLASVAQRVAGAHGNGAPAGAVTMHTLGKIIALLHGQAAATNAFDERAIKWDVVARRLLPYRLS